MSDSTPGLLRRIFSDSAFVVVVILLFCLAAGFEGAKRYLDLTFRKLPVPLAAALDTVPEKLGPWVQVTIDEPLSHEIQETLATDKYVFRTYIDTRVIPEEDVAKFKDKTPNERLGMARQLQDRFPRAVMRMSLTYYTGLADTVAHVPDRCFVADGYEPSHYEIEAWPALANLDGDKLIRYIVFEDSTPNRASVPVSVAYFFNCNGKYTNDSITVRKSLANLFEKYGYYMKIELMTLNLPKDQGATVMDEFLTHAIPEVSKCLPDWEKLHAQPAAPEKPAAQAVSLK